MLMQRMHSDARWNCARSSRQAGAECIVPFVCDTDPVNCAQDDRLARAQQHDAPRSQAKVPFVGDRVVSHPAADRRRRVDIEDGERQL